MLKLHKRMQSGFTIIELLIVIAIIGILATLVLTNFQGAQAKGRDVTRKSDINSLYNKLEEYHNENGSYPDGALDTATFTGIDEEALLDSDGATIVSTFSTAVPSALSGLTTTNEYVYAAFGDGTAGSCVEDADNGCLRYTLGTFLEREDDNFEKSSLN